MEVEQKFMSIPVEYTLDDILDLNDDLAKGVLRVAYTGENRNGSCISREAFENAVGSLPYKPVVAHYIADKDDFGGHDGEVEETDDGDIVYRNITEPVGVVPEKMNWHFEKVLEDGVEREYCVIDVLLWKRQRSYDVIRQKDFTRHSMEIEVLDGHRGDDGYYHIDGFKFLAFCLLGDDVEPCFEGSKLRLFELDKVQESFALFVAAIRDYEETKLPLADMVSASGGNINSTTGKEEIHLEIIEKFEQIGVDPAALGLDLEAMTEEDVEAKLFELTSNLMEQISEAIRVETYETEWGEMSRYWIVDTDLAAQLVYCVDTADYKLYGLSYTMDGDAVKVDFAEPQRMKYAIVPFEEGGEDITFGFAAEMIKDRAAIVQDKLDKLTEEYTVAMGNVDVLTANLNHTTESLEQKEQEYAALKEQTDALMTANAELEQYKANVEAEKVRSDKEGLFEKWSTLVGGMEEFTSLRENMDQYDMEEIEVKLKCLYADAKANFELKPVQEKKTNRVPVGVGKTAPDTGDYGGLYEKYGIKPIR